jgi:tetratricopeptide (TPR) repeat protein
MKRIRVPVMAVALIALLSPREASADSLGACARQGDLDKKIASCIEASKSTSYPWILHWVYRELARAYRERGEIQKAIASYEQSLATEERESVRREMEELFPLTQ